MSDLDEIKLRGAFAQAIAKFHETLDVEKTRLAEEEKLHRRKAELEELILSQELDISRSDSDEETINLQCALGKIQPEDVDKRRSQRTAAEKTLSGTKSILNRLESYINDFEAKKYGMIPPEQAAFKVIFEIMKNDMIMIVLPSMKRAIACYTLSTGYPIDLPALIFDNFQFRNPTNNELREHTAELRKILSGEPTE